MADTIAAGGYQPVNDEEYINKMYDSNLASQKQTLQQGYDQNIANLDAEKQANQRQTDANLNRTYVESLKAQQGYDEVMNAYGLNSGAKAQARLARDNQLQSDLTALRTAQQTADTEIERQRSLLAQQYASAIAQAQADNDMQRAQALYDAAKADEERLYEKQLADEERQFQLQKEAGNLMATKNDYSILGQLYGLTEEQIALLSGGGGGGYEEPKKTYSTSAPSAVEDDKGEDNDPQNAVNGIDYVIRAAQTMSQNGASGGTVEKFVNAAAGAGIISNDEKKSLKYLPTAW